MTLKMCLCIPWSSQSSLFDILEFLDALSLKVLVTEMSLLSPPAWPSTFLLLWLAWSLWYLLCLAGVHCGAKFSEAVKTLSRRSLLRRVVFHGGFRCRSLSTRRFPGRSKILLGLPTVCLGPDDTWSGFFYFIFYDSVDAAFLPFHVTFFF